MLAAKFSLAGLTIGQCEVDIMNRSTVAIFEILEKAWATQNCTLVDMKAGSRPCWLFTLPNNRTYFSFPFKSL